jgi:hypothetical protein
VHRQPGTPHITRNNTIRHINKDGEQSFMRLSQVVQLSWPTPRTQITRPTLIQDGGNKFNLEEVMGEVIGRSGSHLSPDWVEHLMGYPQGYSLPNGPPALVRSLVTNRPAWRPPLRTAPHAFGHWVTRSCRTLCIR